MNKNYILIDGGSYPQYIFDDIPTEFIEIGNYIGLRWNIKEDTIIEKTNGVVKKTTTFRRLTKIPYIVFEYIRDYGDNDYAIGEDDSTRGGIEVSQIEQIIKELTVAKRLIKCIKGE